MKKLISPLLIILSAVLFGLVPAVIRFTYDYGGNGINLNFFMALIAIPILLLQIRLQKHSMRVTKREIGKIVTLSLLGSSMAPLLLMISYSYIPTGMATTLHFIYPVLVAFGLVLFFKEKLNAWKVTALLVAVAGIAVMSLDGVEANPIGIVLAFLSGIAWAFYIIYLDKSGLSRLAVPVLACYLYMVGVCFFGVVGLATGQLQPLRTPIAWVCTVIAALMGSVIAGPCFQLGIRGAGPLAAGILSTFEPITSVIVGILFLGEASTVGKIIGCVLVVIGVCLIVYSDYKAAHQQPVTAEHGAHD